MQPLLLVFQLVMTLLKTKWQKPNTRNDQCEIDPRTEWSAFAFIHIVTPHDNGAP